MWSFRLFLPCLLLGVLCQGQDTATLVPSSAPRTDDGISPAPTPVICPDELSTLEECFASQSNPEITRDYCESCVVQYFPDQMSNCGDLASGTCQGLQDCDCGTCNELVVAYIQCLSPFQPCTIDCNAEPTVSPAPTVSLAPSVSLWPTRPIVCPDEYGAFNGCVDPNSGGSTCEDCLTSLWPYEIDQCSDIADLTCTGLEQCECNGCDAQWLTYLTCLTDGCTFDCDSAPATPSSTVSPAPTPHPCPDEKAAIRSCLEGAGVDVDGCSGCIQDAFPATFSECTDIDEAVCSGLGQCECGGGECDAEILANVNCAFETTFEKSCQISCDGTLAPASSPGVAAPTASSQCPDERDAFDQCVQATGEEASQCETCVTGYWPETFDRCSEIQNGTCLGLSNCPCASCGGALLEFTQCVSGGCSLKCGDDRGVTSSPTPTTTSGAATTVLSSFALSGVAMGALMLIQDMTV